MCLRQTARTEEKVRGDVEAPKRGPASAACVSQWRKPSRLAMTQMRTATEASEQGRRWAVSPFVSVVSLACSNKQGRGRKSSDFLIKQARRQLANKAPPVDLWGPTWARQVDLRKDRGIVFGFQTTCEMKQRMNKFPCLWEKNLRVCACALHAFCVLNELPGHPRNQHTGNF